LSGRTGTTSATLAGRTCRRRATCFGFVNGKQHPLLEVPESECYEAVGSAARSFVNLRGVGEVALT
jgi:hypothetical protein